MSNLPQEFINRIRDYFPGEADNLLEAVSFPSATSVRLNPQKRISSFNKEEKVVWCKDAFFLASRPSFTMDPLFHAGCYYVQEASSMFLEVVFSQIRKKVSSPLRVLDLCAAPGGKSTHLLSLMNEKDLLISNEVIASRVSILKENIIKWGNDNCIVTQNEAGDFYELKNYFDIVIVDAPCSGEGLFRKDKGSISEWSENNVSHCSARQQTILNELIHCIKPGGFLIYSTCTYEPAENENQLHSLVSSGDFNSIKIDFNCTEAGITEINHPIHGYYFLPHKVKSEGFFISCLQKNVTDDSEQRTKKIHDRLKPVKVIPAVNSFLKNEEQYDYFEHDKNIIAIKNEFRNELNHLLAFLRIKMVGVNMGTIKGSDFIPHHQLALSNHFNSQNKTLDLNYDKAIRYLRGEMPVINTLRRNGFAVATYEGFHLGWSKILPNRINNLYPKEYRIRK